MSQDPHDKLESFVHRALRGTPPGRAPAALEARVLAAIARQQRQPWWRLGWAAWPMLPRVAVLGAATAAIAAATWGASAGPEILESTGWSTWGSPLAGCLLTLRTAAETIGGVFAICVQSFQPWLVTCLAVMAAAYLALVALGSRIFQLVSTKH